MRSNPTHETNPVSQIAAHFGGQNGLARALRTSQGTIWRWVQNRRVPSDQIPRVIDAALSLSPPLALRPDHFFGTAEVPPIREEAA